MKTPYCVIFSLSALILTACGGVRVSPPAASGTSTTTTSPTTPSTPTTPSQPTTPTTPTTPSTPSTPTSPSSPTSPSTPVATPIPAAGKVLSNIQASQGWKDYGQLAPAYSDCPAPCPGITWSMTQGIASPSTTGKAAQFDLGGTTPYSDVLWTNPLIGQFSTQGLPDTNHTLIPTLHNFVYDADFYVTDASVTQVLEFDINMFLDGIGMTWGHQCNNLGDGDWDISNNSGMHWKSTGVPCKLIDNGWNHVTIQVQRESDNTLIFQSITLNGETSELNITSVPYSVGSTWYGVTVNYQMDGDHKQSPNTTYLDNFSLTYW